MCQCLICVPVTYTEKLETENPLENIHCAFCYHTTQTTKLVKKTYLTFLYVPFILIKTSDPFIGCDRCRSGFSAGDVKVCHNCRNVIVDDNSFCPRCGFRVREPDTKQQD
ncbi:hypothetical protein VCUG_00647 [Vavraia culicis subsp. floridensis]|uniref:Zinc-ribbon 15 domain-containing protein n=1 Tax=Vavraia culicis (isolate floridensis) TaxID=948595 RepID=L2GXH3_VAVCU|nr:uncharacterized protein VCUG_00647 [Vavraia culicis subsp. floridensis]ELA47805.1 hypothetical protein VCUG_00647 [Vavraia culicis subsp. floridensis]